MDLPTAVTSYQFAERAKSSLIMVSQLCIALPSFQSQEKAGGKRMLLMMMDSIRSEIQFALNSTGRQDFQKAINHLNEAISLVEADHPEHAVEMIALAISASTTSAQEAWQVLTEHGIH